MMNSQFLLAYLTDSSYLGIFILLAVMGTFIPVPEEVFLLLIGYAAGTGVMNLYVAIAVSMLGVVAGDNLLFWLSRRGGWYVRWLFRHLRPEQLARQEARMQAHLGKTIFALRFVIGLRFLSPLLAGSSHVKWRTFQLFDGLAVLVYVPLFVLLGHRFHAHVASLITSVEAARHAVAILGAVGVGGLIALLVYRRFFTRSVH